MLCLPVLSLDEALESSLYKSYETIAGLNSLAQTAAEMEKNYYSQTENAIPIDVILIKELESTNTIDGDNLTDCPNISPFLAGIKIVRKSSRFFSKFD